MKFALVAAGLLSVGGGFQDPANVSADTDAPVRANSNPVQPDQNTDAATAQAPADGAVAPAIPQPASASVKLSPGAVEIAKLAQSGIGDDVMLAYVSTATQHFNLGSDEIVYLNDLGVSGPVVKAMIERDTALNNLATPPNTAAVVQPPDDVPYSPPPLPPPVSDSVATNPGYPDYPGNYYGYDDSSYVPPPEEDVASDYFYDSLAPYGSWVNIGGFGRCWQPTVVVVNHDWRPYCDRGRWIYSDCGWYWQSDYSWGWAPFHYGRWFCDARCGWVWRPGSTWGPAWVSWRHSGEFCGWAPLPPFAHFAPGVGFTRGNHLLGSEHEFGLRSGHYTFVPIERLGDYAPHRYALTPAQAERIYNQTAVVNYITTRNGRVFNQGIDPAQVAAVSGTAVRHATIHELPPQNGVARPDRLEKSGNSLVIFRPQLPRTAPHPSAPAGGRNIGNRSEVLPPVRVGAAVATSPNSAPPRPVTHLPNMNLSGPSSVSASPGPRPFMWPQPPQETKAPANSLVVIGRNQNQTLPSLAFSHAQPAPGLENNPPQNATIYHPLARSYMGYQNPAPGAQWNQSQFHAPNQTPSEPVARYQFNSQSAYSAPQGNSSYHSAPTATYHQPAAQSYSAPTQHYSAPAANYSATSHSSSGGSSSGGSSSQSSHSR